MREKRLAGLGCLLMLMVLIAPASVLAIPVDLELALLVDVSGSVDATEFALQRDGYAGAFQNPAVISAIQGGPIGSIAATLVYWSGPAQQQQAVGWTLIDDPASGAGFATGITNAPRPFFGNTSISNALLFSAPLFVNNGFEGTREAMDVSGDGENNAGADINTARNTALQEVDAINGLPIGSASLLAYYQSSVIGGTNAFAIPAANFADFDTAVTNKLRREVQPGVVPEPCTMLLIGTGALGIGAIKRIRKKLHFG